MAFCTGCGHRLSSVGRFCTNCGRPLPDDVSGGDTLPRPEVAVPSGPPPSAPPPSAPPPPAYTAPSAPRFPLYADDSGGAPITFPAAPPPSSSPRPPARRTGPSFLAVALIAVILLLVAVIGALLLFSGGGDDDSAGDPGSSESAQQDESTSPSSEPPTSPSGPPSTPPPSEGSQDIARYATVEAPRTAKPNLDTNGNLVRYDATNMVDGVPSTCWRTEGDGTGLEITFTFAQPVELTEVGMINGYAKSAGKLDWYKGNRKVLAAQWQFDDGTTVDQTLTQTRDLQTMPVDNVTTSTVVLRLTSVSAPGRGPSARNYTPISDVSLVGASA